MRNTKVVGEVQGKCPDCGSTKILLLKVYNKRDILMEYVCACSNCNRETTPSVFSISAIDKWRDIENRNDADQLLEQSRDQTDGFMG